MGFDIINKIRTWFLHGSQNKANDPANTAATDDSTRAAKRGYPSLSKDPLPHPPIKYRRVDNTFPKFMPNDADDYGHMANPTQREELHEVDSHSQRRLSMFCMPQTRSARVRKPQNPVTIDLSDTEEQHHNESNMYQAFADRLVTVPKTRSNDYGNSASATRPNLLYSEAVRYGTNGFAGDLNYPRPSSSSESSEVRLNGHAGSMFDSAAARTNLVVQEEQRIEHSQYIHLINNLSLHERDSSLTQRATTSRDIEKAPPLMTLRGDEWLHGLVQKNLVSSRTPITSERDEYAKLLSYNSKQPQAYPFAKKQSSDVMQSFSLGGDITDISTGSDNFKFLDKENYQHREAAKKTHEVTPPSMLLTKAIQKRNSQSIYFADNFAEIFEKKCARWHQESNHAKQLVIEEAEKVTQERRAYEQGLRESLLKHRYMTKTMFVLEKFPAVEESEPQLIPFNEEHQKTYNELVYGKPEKVLITKFSLSITRKDIRTLLGSSWLNDEVINFYMNLLTDRSQRKQDTLPSVYAMNTFFVPRLLQGYSNVRRWTRKVDIFSKDIIPVPVHVSNVHWCMAIIHMKNKTIRYYDSMGKPNSEVLSALEKYLREESLDKRKKPFDTSDFTIENVQEVPYQTNGSDCGVFSCMFAEYITRNQSISFTQEHMEYFRKKMVLEICDGELWM